ncbi:MAG: hypothetical protein ACUVX1_12900 [Chloroflexota bacterium]
MPWLKLKEGETVYATINFPSIKSVAKHWTGQRSELCLQQGCPHCAAGIPKRWRYQASLIVDGSTLQWEFGERTMTDLTTVPHDTNFGRITITRIGDARNTQYQIRDQSHTNYQQIADQMTEALVRRYYANESTEEKG